MERDGKMEWKGRGGKKRLGTIHGNASAQSFQTREILFSLFLSRNEHLHETDIPGNAGVAWNGETEGMLKL